METVDAAARALRERLVEIGAVKDPDKLRRRMNEDRPEDVVAMGERAFLLHYRTDATTDLCVALGTSRRPFCRTLPDGEPQCARILLLVIAPPRLAARYLQVVGAFARFLSGLDRVDRVLAQPSAEAVAALAEFREYELPAQLTVREIMTDRPHVARAEDPLRKAAREMVRSHIGSLPVVDEKGRLLGLLTEREIIRELLATAFQREMLGTMPRNHAAAHGPERVVRDVMTRQVLCVSPEQPLADVASLMAHKNVDRVPVVDDGRLVGFLTRGDIVRKLIGS
ncbi:MAG TPA: CBS domain-containing protein [Vicinamibacterales bacterium]